MDIGRSFTYITEDEEWWKKILIGGLLSLIPIIGPFYLIGYALQVTRNVIAGQEIPLPEPLEDFGPKLGKGFMFSIIVFIYMLPFIIVGSCAGGGASVLTENIADPTARDVVPAVWGVCFGCLSLLYSILFGLFIPFVWAQYALTGRFGDAFRIGEFFGMLRNNIGPAFIVMIVVGAAVFVASLAGSLLCGLGIIFTSFYAQLVAAFLYGLLYNKARAAVS